MIFLLDSAYLPGLRTLAYSLRNALAEKTHDVLVLTNDPRVAEDALVKHIAHDVHVLSDEDIAKIKTVDADAVTPEHRHAEFGKYTFLKFLAFKDFGYDHHIFLDVDMVCLDPTFRFSDLVADCDFSAAPTMGLRFFADTPTQADAIEKIEYVIATRFSPRRPINSGTFFVGRSLLSDASVGRLIRIGHESAFPLEQQITQQFVQRTPGIRFHSLSVQYNFVERAARRIGREAFHAFAPVFLHYNQNAKPWQEASPRDWVTDFWHSEADAASHWVGVDAVP